MLTSLEEQYKKAYEGRNYPKCHKLIRKLEEIFDIDTAEEIVNDWEQEVGTEYRPGNRVLVNYK